jgi:hypothetical protein
LTSLLFQLSCSCDSDSCWDVLHALYTEYRDGSEQLSDTALAGYLKCMLGLPGQLPVFIILDAIDECPNTTGTPSSREKVLDFVEDLVGSDHPNLFIFETSRPEPDIWTVLSPLTPAWRRVSLHEEAGQRADINNYVRFFVHWDVCSPSPHCSVTEQCGGGEQMTKSWSSTSSRHELTGCEALLLLPTYCHSKHQTGFAGHFASRTLR